MANNTFVLALGETFNVLRNKQFSIKNRTNHADLHPLMLKTPPPPPVLE